MPSTPRHFPRSPGLFLTRMGQDQVTGTVRNLVLVDGSIAADPFRGNVFNRVLILRMRLQTPETGIERAIPSRRPSQYRNSAVSAMRWTRKSSSTVAR